MKFKDFYKIYERAYHGSAAKIKGPFSYDKIGSGQGAQAFGYGFYFTESMGYASSYVAQSYKASYRYKRKDANYWYDLFNSQNDYGKAEIWEYIMLHKSRDQIREMLIASEAKEEDLKYLDSLPDSLFAPSAGGLYEVELNTTVNELLNWHETLTEQSDFVKNKIKTLEEFIKNGYYHRYSGPFDIEKLHGGWLYQSLKESFSVPQESGGLERTKYDISHRKDKNVSFMLRELGIKGNLVATENDKEGNRTIVMFSSDDISIVKEL